MARPELGTKRICGECGTRFYDLMRKPIVCPKCGTEFVVVVAAATTAKAKPAAAKPPAPKVEVKEEVAIEDDVPLVALEDADAEAKDTGRAETDDAEDDDLPEVEDDSTLEDDDDDDSFLADDEEDGDDVGALIEGDLDEDEET